MSKFYRFQAGVAGDTPGVIACSMKLHGEGRISTSFTVVDTLEEYDGFVLKHTEKRGTLLGAKQTVIGYALKHTVDGTIIIALPADYNTPIIREQITREVQLICVKPTAAAAAAVQVKTASKRAAATTPLFSTPQEAGEEKKEEAAAPLLQHYSFSALQTLSESSISLTLYRDGWAAAQFHSELPTADKKLLLTGLPSTLQGNTLRVDSSQLIGYQVENTESMVQAATSLGMSSDLVGRRVRVTWIDNDSGSSSGGKKKQQHVDTGIVASLILPDTALQSNYRLALYSEETPSKLIAIYGHIVKLEVEARRTDLTAYLPPDTLLDEGSLLCLRFPEPVTALSLWFLMSRLSYKLQYLMSVTQEVTQSEHDNNNKVLLSLALRATIKNHTGVRFLDAHITFVDGPLQQYNSLPYDIGLQYPAEFQSQSRELQLSAEPEGEEEAESDEPPTPASTRVEVGNTNTKFVLPFPLDVERNSATEWSAQYVNAVNTTGIRATQYYVYGVHVPGAPPGTSAVGVSYQWKNSKKNAELGWPLPRGSVIMTHADGSTSMTELKAVVQEDEVASIYCGESYTVDVKEFSPTTTKHPLEGEGTLHIKSYSVRFNRSADSSSDNNNGKPVIITLLVKKAANERITGTQYSVNHEDVVHEVGANQWASSSKARPNPFTGAKIDSKDESYVYFTVPLQQETVVQFNLEHVSNK